MNEKLREARVYYKVFKCLLVMEYSGKLPATKETIYNRMTTETISFEEVSEVIKEMSQCAVIFECLDENEQLIGYSLF